MSKSLKTKKGGGHDVQESEPLALLKEGVGALGLELLPAALEQMRIYLEELQVWNAKTNLTGLKNPRDMVIKHFLDSLAVLPFVGRAVSLMDLGSGAGFPGLVLKLARPDLNLILVESRQKKAAFLEYMVSRLRLTDVAVVQTHLTPALAQNWEPKVDAVVSRAAFLLPRLLELGAPLLAPGGMVLALKSINLAGLELETAGSACPLLGLEPLEPHTYHLPISGEPRLLLMCRKLQVKAGLEAQNSFAPEFPAAPEIVDVCRRQFSPGLLFRGARKDSYADIPPGIPGLAPEMHIYENYCYNDR